MNSSSEFSNQRVVVFDVLRGVGQDVVEIEIWIPGIFNVLFFEQRACGERVAVRVSRRFSTRDELSLSRQSHQNWSVKPEKVVGRHDHPFPKFYVQLISVFVNFVSLFERRETQTYGTGVSFNFGVFVRVPQHHLIVFPRARLSVRTRQPVASTAQR